MTTAALRSAVIGCLVTALLQPAAARAQGRAALEEARNRMVDEEIAAAGVQNPRVLRAMRTTPRHEFVPLAQRRYAYLDMALPIGYRQTISPPFVVAFMTEQIDPQPGDKVLEIGTGSGYQAAVLSGLAGQVYTIEIVEPLGHRAAQTLRRLRYENVHAKTGDGFLGWPEHAPFDKIIVTCSPEKVPQALVDQLTEGGRMIVPVGQRYQQILYLFKKTDGQLVSETLRPTLFVPMTGEAERLREVQPDPANPKITNGDFEELDDSGKPAGWHYQRQATVISDDRAPSGKNYIRFNNSDPGRGCRALQGIPMDGREVQQLKLSAHIRGDGIRPGPSTNQLPALVVTFFGQNRGAIAEGYLGPWRGSFDWKLESAIIPVPSRAREAIVRIGLLGAVGEISIDAVQIEAK